VVYSGDDQVFEFLYKFVSEGKVTPLPEAAGSTDAIAAARAANRDLLDQGTLYVARLDADGGLTWLPLVQGQGPLTAENGFEGQADVLIEARRAATCSALRRWTGPRTSSPNPVTGKVYVMLTNNKAARHRGQPGADAANPRPENLWGQVLEITPADGDHAADRPLGPGGARRQPGGPPSVHAAWNPATSDNGWFACPDNCALDPAAGSGSAPTRAAAGSKASGGADGVWALETEGAAAAPGACSSACRWARRCADRASRRTGAPCSSQCSIRPPTAPRTMPASSAVHLRGPGNALAGLPGRRAAAPVRGRHHQGRRRRDRRLMAHRPPKIVLAPNALKSSCTAAAPRRPRWPEASRARCQTRCSWSCRGDGGDGLAEVLGQALGGEQRQVWVSGPRFDPLDAALVWSAQRRTSVIEMALASGLALLPERDGNPSATTTLGTGELIRAALDLGAERIIVGLGGSATNDGGIGMAQALGWRFVDAAGRAGRARRRELARHRTHRRLGARCAARCGAHRCRLRRRQPPLRSPRRGRGLRPAEGREPGSGRGAGRRLSPTSRS
jgi:hypothetical protein